MMAKSWCLLAGAALWVPTSGWAQQAAAAEPVPETSAQNDLLHEIIVTAQRREESLQKVAIAVSAVSGDALVQAGISQPQDLGRVVPAIKLQQGGGSNVAIYLRGVGSLTGNAFAENSVALNFNGVYLARPTAVAGFLFDLARVEVVKGPQGTLYGRNATGGAINIIPQAPDLDVLSGEVTAEYGNYDNKRASAALNLPLGETLAMRIAGRVVDRDGYLSDGTQDEVNQAARVSLLVRPSDMFSTTIVGDYYHQGGKGPGSVLLPGSGVPAGTGKNGAPPISDRIAASDPRSIAFLKADLQTRVTPPPCAPDLLTSGCIGTPLDDAYADNTMYGLSASVEGDMGFATLTFLPAYRRTKSDERSYAAGFSASRLETSDQISGELRLASNGDGALRYVLGAYVFSEDTNARNLFIAGRLSRILIQARLQTESTAVFGQGSYEIADGFRLVGGLRYTSETKRQNTRTGSGNLFSPAEPVLGAPFDGKLKFEKVTWKAGVEWDAGPDSLVYANVATGFKSGGFYAASPPRNTFRPEQLTAYTIGSKNRLFDNRLQLNVEGFYWNFRDQQISYIGALPTASAVIAGGVTSNAGKATMYGADVELRYAPTRADLIVINAQYLHARYDSLVYQALSATGAPLRNACQLTAGERANPTVPTDSARYYTVDCSGRPTVNSPDLAVDASYQHVFDLGDLELIAGAHGRAESSRYMDLTYLPEARQAAFFTADISLMLQKAGAWSITGFVNNVANKTTVDAVTLKIIADVDYGILAPPRTYGVRVNYKF